jgi:hypothetical protein
MGVSLNRISTPAPKNLQLNLIMLNISNLETILVGVRLTIFNKEVLSLKILRRDHSQKFLKNQTRGLKISTKNRITKVNTGRPIKFNKTILDPTELAADGSKNGTQRVKKETKKNEETRMTFQTETISKTHKELWKMKEVRARTS